MGKIAFVFSGQGAQYSGMGKSLYNMEGVAKALYDDCESIRPGTLNQSFNGSDEELKKTVNTQPCMYLLELGAALALNEKGIYAHGAAGFSLGEISALAYAKAYSHTDGFKIVTKRGELMHEASDPDNSAMCAVLKLESHVVADTASQFEKLYAVNYNCPDQTVVSGLKSSMELFTEKIKELGGRCIPLLVSGAFHSPFMADAASKFAKELNNYEIINPKIPVYANISAKPYEGKVARYLEQQMKSPVKWQETVENMIKDGFTDFIEVGPGKTLCGLIKKISREVRVYSVENEETLMETVEAINNAES